MPSTSNNWVPESVHEPEKNGSPYANHKPLVRAPCIYTRACTTCPTKTLLWHSDLDVQGRKPIRKMLNAFFGNLYSASHGVTQELRVSIDRLSNMDKVMRSKFQSLHPYSIQPLLLRYVPPYLLLHAKRLVPQI